MAQSTRFSTHQKRHAIQSNAPCPFQCKLLAIDTWIYLRNESKFAEPKSKQNKNARASSNNNNNKLERWWTLEIGGGARLKGSINLDVMITLSLALRSLSSSPSPSLSDLVSTMYVQCNGILFRIDILFDARIVGIRKLANCTRKSK